MLTIESIQNYVYICIYRIVAVMKVEIDIITTLQEDRDGSDYFTRGQGWVRLLYKRTGMGPITLQEDEL